VSGYARPDDLDDAIGLLAAGDALALAGGSDVVPLVRRGKRNPATLVDVRRLLPSGVEPDGDGVRIGAGTTLAALAGDPHIASGYVALRQAASLAASPQLRNAGTVGGNLAQAVRCWYYRHPDLTCWLNGGDTCYAQIGDHRKHGLEAGDCISVAPSDLSAPLGALGAELTVRGPAGERTLPLLGLYARPDDAHRTAVRLEPGELILSLRLPAPPDASHYERAGERAAWSFAQVGVAAARRGSERRLVAIGVTNEPRELDPADPLRGLDGLAQTGWKRRLLAALSERALAATALDSTS
jgi:xanthine dehydrogenase YagS FAD-binding subunit